MNENDLGAFREELELEEKSRSTVEKYLRDAAAFCRFAAGRPLTKALVLAYKAALLDAGYAPRSVNAMLAGINRLLEHLHHPDCRVKTVKLQRQIFCPAERELSRAEYERLLAAAKQSGNERLYLLLQTIGGTGIRIGELKYITVEAARQGEAVVRCKGKTRVVLLVRPLQKQLLAYAKAHGVKSGPIFITRSGKALDRSNVWREMRGLCKQARVQPGKVFPHNLRHLFARVFYKLEKDIAKLADVLGHSSIETTRIYIISTGSEHRQHMEHMKLVI